MSRVNIERLLRHRKAMPRPTNCAWWSREGGACQEKADWQNANGSGLCEEHDYLFFRLWFADPYQTRDPKIGWGALMDAVQSD